MEIFRRGKKGAVRVIIKACTLTKNTVKSKREGDMSGMPSLETRRQSERFFLVGEMRLRRKAIIVKQRILWCK